MKNPLKAPFPHSQENISKDEKFILIFFEAFERFINLRGISKLLSIQLSIACTLKTVSSNCLIRSDFYVSTHLLETGTRYIREDYTNQPQSYKVVRACELQSFKRFKQQRHREERRFRGAKRPETMRFPMALIVEPSERKRS